MAKGRHIVIMGVSGSGKTTLAQELAAQMARPFLDADDYHPPENILKMKHEGLTDEDRWPWLNAVAQAMSAHPGAVVACSLLKARYRTYLRRLVGRYRLIYLPIDADAARLRVAAREGHFAGPELIWSQFEALEPPRKAKRILKQ